MYLTVIIRIVTGGLQTALRTGRENAEVTCWGRLFQVRVAAITNSGKMRAMNNEWWENGWLYTNNYNYNYSNTVTVCVERCCACRHRHMKFDRGLGQILHDELHWLDVPDRVFFKLAVTVHRCLNGRAPPYLSDYCVPAAGVDTRQHLPSANCQLLAVPHYRLNTYGRRAFSVDGPTVWNFVPDLIRDPIISADSFRRLLKTYLFTRY